MSIRLRLILILTLATSAIWLSAALWINVSTRAQVEQVLDARLAEAANMVSSLMADRRIALDETAAQATIALPGAGEYSRQLSCQIWSLRGNLLGASSGAPAEKLSEDEGFATTLIDGEPWRVFTVVNSNMGVRVMVGDRIQVRDRLVGDVVQGLLWPLVVVFPALALLIWVSVGRGLAPLAHLESTLRNRKPDDLSPLVGVGDPREIRPVRRALNSLFQRLDDVRRTERDFTAFAAHELKTPLAGLRTHAQIARMTSDPAVRERALATITTSVDRTDRMVRQLLNLTAIDQDAASVERLDVAALLSKIAQQAEDQARLREVRLDVQAKGIPPLVAPRILVHSALRNLVENAIQHSPPGGTVRLIASCDGAFVVLSVRDEGPGIRPQDRDRVTDRFWRGPGREVHGSGLGLAIVAAAVQRMDGRMELGSGSGGQEVTIALPLSSI
ncbi:sensor histidine kinase [Paracoccus tibetensis]|uniref:histidine kinase n=1 Tax=Paracoccus tibetensis TaxID=336292 RepID=A0A1G5JNR7_9RHOB|nr:sensor histidine kinase [Paracoccus tibetensis]SCY89531.1 two-component system, OmpR family, sensor histidine kinase QseC [Paracoccus tibetensis]